MGVDHQPGQTLYTILIPGQNPSQINVNEVRFVSRNRNIRFVK